MITPHMIQRINALAKKKREVGLTAAEMAEQTALRAAYIDNIKAQLKDHLDMIEIVDPRPN